MARRPKFKVRQVEEALAASAGIFSLAAAKLHCSPSTIANYVERHRSLRKRLSEILEETLDLAESKLLEKIGEGHPTAIIFYLKTKGKARGYVERSEVTGAGGGAVNIDVTKLSDEELERIARGDLTPVASAGRARTEEEESP